MKDKEALESISKYLFTASEALEEVLDTADLCDIDLGHWATFLEATRRILEDKAKLTQKEARSEDN